MGRAALLARLYSQTDQELIPFCFSWPSNGDLTPWDYRSDQNDAMASGYALARAYRSLYRLLTRIRCDDRCNAPIHMFCHSMGVFASRHAVQALPVCGVRHIRLFHSVVLVAPDDDCDALGRNDKLRPLGRLTRRLDVYFNPEDKATILADAVGSGEERLGSSGPSDMAELAEFGCPVTAVNCLGVSDPDLDSTGNHYYRTSDVVIEDIKDVFAGSDRLNANCRVGRFDETSGHVVL